MTGFGWENGISENEIQFSTLIDPLPTGSVSYNWDFGDGNVSTDANPLHPYSQAGEYGVCLDLTLETAGSPSCSGDEFVYPAFPDVRPGWRNHVIHIKQYPTGITNPLTLNRLIINCPEATWETVIGGFVENDLGALTPADIVSELVNYVNVTQSSPDWYAIDLNNGYYLLQIHDSYNGFQYPNNCVGGVCLTGTTGFGTNLYWGFDGTLNNDLQDNNFLSFAENWDCSQIAGDTICLGTEGSGTPAEQCTVQICETVTVPCVQEPLDHMEWVGRLSAFEVVGNNTNLNLDPPPLGNPTPEVMEVHANNLQSQTYLSKLHQTMGCCTSLSGTFYVASTSPDVISVLNTNPLTGEWTVTLGNDGQGSIVITCADFDTLATGSANFTPVSGAFQWLSQMVVIQGSGDLSLLATNQVDITIGFGESCYPGDLTAELHILGNQPNCWLNGDAYWSGSTSNLYFDGLCNQFDNDPVTNDDPNLSLLFGGNQVQIDDVNMASNSFSLKMFKPGFECCTNFVDGSTTMSVTLVDTGFSPGTTAVINVLNPTDVEIQFGGTSTGTLTIVAADFASILEDGTTWDDINCEGKYQWLSQAITFIGSADLDISGGYIVVKIEVEGIENDCGLTGEDLTAIFRING